MAEQEQSIRKESLIDSGTLSPNPWDLSLSGQNRMFYTERHWTEDRAPQGCDPSADSSAGIAQGDGQRGRPNARTKAPPNISLLNGKNGLDTGVYFTGQDGFWRLEANPQRVCCSTISRRSFE